MHLLVPKLHLGTRLLRQLYCRSRARARREFSPGSGSPKGAQQVSPGHRPGFGVKMQPSPEGARHHFTTARCPAPTGLGRIRTIYPGLHPGLTCCALGAREWNGPLPVHAVRGSRRPPGDGLGQLFATRTRLRLRSRLPPRARRSRATTALYARERYFLRRSGKRGGGGNSLLQPPEPEIPAA